MLDQFARGMEASEDTTDGICGSTCLLRLNLPKDMGTMKFATFKAALGATFSSGR